MEYAGVARRFGAVLIDGLVFLVVALIIGLLTGGAYSTEANGVHQFGIQVGDMPMLVALVVLFAYYVLCEVFFGRTLGKRALGLRVVAEGGSQIGLGPSLVRNALRIVDGLFFYLVAAIAVWCSPTRQRLGDRVARTWVVRDSAELDFIRRTPTVLQPGAASGSQTLYTEDDFMSDLARAKQLRRGSPG